MFTVGCANARVPRAASAAPSTIPLYRFMLVRNHHARRITTKRSVRLQRLIMTIENNIATKLSSGKRSSIRVLELEEPRERNTWRWTRNVNLQHSRSNDEVRCRNHRTSHVSGKGSRGARTIIWRTLEVDPKTGPTCEGGGNFNHQLKRWVITNAHIPCTLVSNQDRDAEHMQIKDLR